MKQRHIAVNILTAIPAFLLSIVLVLSLMGAAVYGVVLNCVTPKAISDVVQASVKELVKSPDFEQVILDNETVQANIQELGITTEAVGELMQSDAVVEVVDLLSADFSNALTGVAEAKLTPEALLDIVTKHADDLADIAVKMSAEPLDKEEIKKQIIDTVERDAEALTDVMPDVEVIRQSVTDNDTAEKVLALLNPTYLWYAYGVCLVLALLIYALRYYRFGGFLWLGVSGMFAGGLIGVAIWALRNLSTNYLPDSLSNARGIINTLISHIARSLQWRMWIYLGVSLLLIGGFVLLYFLVVKKKLAAAAQPMAEAMPEAAYVAETMPETAYVTETAQFTDGNPTV